MPARSNPAPRSHRDVAPTIFTLQGTLQPYAWGDVGAIAALLGVDVEGPVAEYWMGAHTRAPSIVVETGQTLDAMIATDPITHLGTEAGQRLLQLPFLLKVLAAAAPLSIQTHPTADQATEGFAAENKAGVPLDSAERVFRDPNPKPELVVALDTFSARIGFRPLHEARAVLDAVAQAQPERWERAGGAQLVERLASGGYQGVLEWLVSLDPDIQHRLAEAFGAAAGRLEDDDAVAVRFATEHHGSDIGIVILVLLNHIELSPGEAVFLRAGTLHAYLRGLAVEVMANSDNVIRGGLTQKHIDPERLIALATTIPEAVTVQRRAAAIWRYDNPGAPFSLVAITAGTYADSRAVPRIVFVSAGSATIATDADIAEARAGTALYIPAQTGGFRVETVGADNGADTTVWVAEAE